MSLDIILESLQAIGNKHTFFFFSIGSLFFILLENLVLPNEHQSTDSYLTSWIMGASYYTKSFSNPSFKNSKEKNALNVSHQQSPRKNKKLDKGTENSESPAHLIRTSVITFLAMVIYLPFITTITTTVYKNIYYEYVFDKKRIR